MIDTEKTLSPKDAPLTDAALKSNISYYWALYEKSKANSTELFNIITEYHIELSKVKNGKNI